MSDPLPRLVTLMGSGEFAPRMVRAHRSVLSRLGRESFRAVLIPTPFAFQENANELAQHAIDFFDESLHITLRVAGQVDDHEQAEPFAAERFITDVRDARFVFSGPGSPSYALRHWQGTSFPELLKEKLTLGGAVTFASAAALTLGAFTIPVYEIYKVGEPPRWLDGLDVMSCAGMRVAVIPHYDNAEGGTHDTRYCYLGERRLRMIEEELPEDAFILGIDEHSAAIFDLDARSATVLGRGGMTIRNGGVSTVFDTGSTVSFDEIFAAAFRSSAPNRHAAVAQAAPVASIAHAERRFADAIRSADASGAVAVVLELLTELARDTSSSTDAHEQFVARLRAMVVELGTVATSGLRDPRELLAPLVDIVIEARNTARTERRFEQADTLRDEMTSIGIELRDTPEGTQWELIAPA
jgi:hypothetical protein